MDSFDELAKRLYALAESVAIAAPKYGGGLRNEPRWVFGPSDNSSHAIEYYQTVSAQIDWPRMPIGSWIATFDGFKEIVALLDKSPHVHKWISTRVSGPDAANVRTAGLQLFVEEFIMGIMDDAAWRVHRIDSRTLGRSCVSCCQKVEHITTRLCFCMDSK